VGGVGTNCTHDIGSMIPRKTVKSLNHISTSIQAFIYVISGVKMPALIGSDRNNNNNTSRHIGHNR
jgi:hypothetical protein